MPPDHPPTTSGRDAGTAHAPSQPTNHSLRPAPTTLPVLDSVCRYEKLGRIGEGTYGVVYKARDTVTGALVALKRLRMGRHAPGGDAGGTEFGRDGMPVTSVRELACLQAGAADPHLVRLHAVVTDPAPESVFLVFEYCPYELAAVLDAAPAAFSLPHVKDLAHGLLTALDGLHARFTLHRDVKPSNMLLTGGGVLKLCDCGLARPLPATGLARVTPGEADDGAGPRPPPPLTPKVQTLWYRAPELLWGAATYGEGVDTWSAGCVLGELLAGRPLFPERSEGAVVAAQARLLGAPSPRIWPGLAALPGWREAGAASMRSAAGANPYNFLASTIGAASGLSRAGCDLLNGLLTYDPAARLTARAALRHAWFAEEPAARGRWDEVGRVAERAMGDRRRALEERV